MTAEWFVTPSRERLEGHAIATATCEGRLALRWDLVAQRTVECCSYNATSLTPVHYQAQLDALAGCFSREHSKLPLGSVKRKMAQQLTTCAWCPWATSGCRCPESRQAASCFAGSMHQFVHGGRFLGPNLGALDALEWVRCPSSRAKAAFSLPQW